MGKRRKGYAAEFQQQIVRLVRWGRTPEELGREFEPSAQAIRNWVKQAEIDEGSRTDGLKTEDTASGSELLFSRLIGPRDENPFSRTTS